MLAYLRSDVRIIYKKSLSLVPLLGWSIAVGGHIPIDRSNPFRARRSLLKAAERIRAGTSVLVFPEGTRSPDGAVGHFKRGSFSLALDASCPGRAGLARGREALVPRGLASLKPGTITLRVHPPIPVSGRSKDDAEALAEEMRRVVRGRLREEASA